ncbi:hypothetical protein F5Y01DRAFT_295423 [Xylaria sp. FL0043]|nr:hypothetical protein F5Y01DRAFT_295423 [Xylaria sp. FL0043]
MPRPKSPRGTPDAGNEGPGSGTPRKRVTRPDSADENAGRDSARKRRRRAFSCLSCQRLKCRCEYDPGAQGCHRCQTLRIVCSLRGQNDAAQGPCSGDTSRLGVEERLQRHEDALEEIKSMIKALGSQKQSLEPSSRAHADSDGPEEGAPTANHDTADPEYLLKPVDRGSKSAPIVVLREISQHVTLGYRRMLGHGNPDLVQLQLLDEQMASELIELFIKHQGHTLLVRSYEELRHYGAARQVSAFLHSVCCLIGVVYRNDICGTVLHRQMYEQVRITLGQALLSSPLDLDELNAMFIMSNNANAPSNHGVEYIDSWLLTGYCAKQAMLNIYFTQIVDRLKKGSSTIEDHRAMHLWSTICLHHLHWAATTGRPSIIPKGSHINQCNVLLSFYRATMQDGMLVAEIMLYSILHQKLLQESYPSDGRECEEFRNWKQRWNHLLALPTSSMLRIGYHAACLILAVRALGTTGEAPGSTSFLATDNSSVTGSASIATQTNDQTPVSEERRDSNWAESEMTGGETSDSKSHNATGILRVNTCKYAKLVVETFLEMPTFLMDTAPTVTCLCLGYCALVLSHYDSLQSQIPDAIVLSLITRLDQWIKTSPGKAWSYKYGALAIRKIEARMNSVPAPADSQTQADARGHGSQDNSHGQVNLEASSRDPTDENNPAYPTDDISSSIGHTVDPNAGLPPFDLSEHDFPSMEGFFGGGFLDFMR